MIRFSILYFIILSIGILSCNEVKKESNSLQFQKLQHAGCSEVTINRIITKGISDDEIDEIVLMRNAGTSEQTIIQLFDRFRKDHKKFTLGEDVAKLRNAGMSDPKIIDVIAYGTLPDWTNDIIKMRNAGISDSAITVLAEIKFSQKKSVISGEDIAKIKCTGMSEVAILHLVENGITSNQIEAVEKMRHQGVSEDEIILRLK